MGQDIVARARVEADRMKTTVSGVPRNKKVTMSVAEFTRLAEMIASLTNPAETWAADGMNDTGHWVPLDHFQRVKAEADHWRGEYKRLSDLREQRDRGAFA